MHIRQDGPEFLVVGPSTGGVDKPPGNTGNEELVVDLELDSVLELLLLPLQHVVQLLCLWRGAGEAIKDKAGGRKDTALATASPRNVSRPPASTFPSSPAQTLLVGLELVLYHADHDLVAHEPALVHDLLGLLAEVCALGHLLSQHVARGQVAHAVVETLEDLGRLRALACAWRTNEDHAHTFILLACQRAGGCAHSTGGLALQLTDLRLELRDEVLKVLELERACALLLGLLAEDG